MALLHSARSLLFHECNIWGNTAPAISEAFWFPVGGAWLARHIWKAYLFSMNKEFLQDNSDIIFEAAIFWVDALVEDERDGTLVSIPSWSPEHGPYSLGCTQDQAIIWDVFNITLKAAAELGDSRPELEEIRSALSRLSPPGIGLAGQFQEWKDEITIDVTGDWSHRHVNHLYGLHPGDQFVAGRSAEEDRFIEAMKVTLNTRGDGGTGWSKAWTDKGGSMQSPGWILVYTRTPIPGCYPGHLANSVHFACSRDGRAFTALHRNYGILHALASVDSRNVIYAKGLKLPWIFTAADGRVGIVAVKTNHDGSPDPEARGKVLLWLTHDLIKFEPQVLVDLKHDADVRQVICRYNDELQVYEFWWQDSTGGHHRNVLADLADLESISPAETVSGWPDEFGGGSLSDCLNNCILPEGAVPGNAIRVKAMVLHRVERKWLPLENIAITVPELVNARSAQDVQAVTATAVYSDGSTARKAVQWQTDGIDFSRPGVYLAKGTVVQEKYNFPLAVGYADPVVFPWNDWYYYAATNDNVNNIGLYVRKGRTVAECFQPGVEEHLILDRDESRGLVQTFWAPEFHLCGGRLYLFFAVSGRQWGPQCHVMRLKEGGEITDPDSWEDPIRVVRRDGSYLCSRGITLDMTYFEIDGTGYVVWSERYHIGTPLDSGSMLYIATVDPAQPWRLTSDPVLLSRPLYGWENVEGTINNEGPYPLLVGDKVYLTYSGGAANGHTYAVGLLSIDRNQNLLDPANWYKSPTAVLSSYSVEGEYGPGHNAFFVNGNRDVMITYHAEPTMRGSKRCTAIRRVHFDIDGEPRFDLSFDRDLRPDLESVTMKVMVAAPE